MAERVAVVGNRRGADLSQVLRFIDSLYEIQPDSILVSGGAVGVDAFAESAWFRLGGRIRSYRPAPWGDGFGVEVWNYGGGADVTAYVSPVEEQRVQLADYRSAALYRDTLIAEDCDRLVAFYRKGYVDSTGTKTTESWATARGALIYSYTAHEEADAA